MKSQVITITFYPLDLMNRNFGITTILYIFYDDKIFALKLPVYYLNKFANNISVVCENSYFKKGID